MVDDATAERIARTGATFRSANEKIHETAGAYGVTGLVPFLCECPDERCREIAHLTLEEYAEVRNEPTHFLNVPGHEERAERAARGVRHSERYVVVEKVGRAGMVARELDPRIERSVDG